MLYIHNKYNNNNEVYYGCSKTCYEDSLTLQTQLPMLTLAR